MNKNYNEKGITLIALVITIIVLLILAGVSIAMLTGENGILTQAQRAKSETENAQSDEEKILDNYEEYLYNETDDVKQVNDTNPGILEGKGTEQEPFIINSIEDLVVFADNVTNGINTYEDQYVELGLSLDFKSDKSYVNPNREDYGQYGYNGKLKELLNTIGFIPVGTTEYGTLEKGDSYFFGYFDGKGHKIYNLKMLLEKSVDENIYMDIGLFSENFGVIQNVFIENGKGLVTINGGKYLAVGLLTGSNNGEIRNCYATGAINTEKTSWGCNIGGLIGANSGIVKECYNETNVDVKYSAKESRIGGLVGVNEKTASIENVYNIGNVSSQVFDVQSGKDDKCLIGGIVGRNIGSIQNAYSIGKISDSNNENVVTIIDAIGGVNNAVLCYDFKNCYYLENLITASEINTEISENGEVKTSEQMKSQEFLDLLNQNNSGIWKFRKGKNNGYPILEWQ